ncbi:MAG TPA: FAD-dependent oxidoreductase, partial [Opitutaceae bacterium]|nr:FAD-dependent oxidoreductase [Opitutaceae bacterium]
MSSELLDVVLIGGGIMSAHVGTLLKSLEPRLKIEVYEAAPEWASESSDAWHNAGTGHAGLCELNYTPPPLVPGATFDVSKAVDIFARFERSRQFWAYAVAQNWMPDPTRFIRRVPHLTFVRGEEATALLRARQSALTAHPLFQSMEFTADRDRISSWTPLLTEGRGLEPLAATRVAAGTDVNFGELSRGLLSRLNQQEGCRVFTGHRVTQLKQADGTWTLTVRHQDSKETRQVCARFVFVGAGGGTLPLLQSARLPLTKGLAAFPIAGQWLLCKNPSVVARHFAKAYGPPPPDSGALGGPHLDVRHIGEERVLL